MGYEDIIREERQLLSKLRGAATDDEKKTQIVALLNKMVKEVSSLDHSHQSIVYDLFLKWRTFLLKEYGNVYSKDILQHTSKLTQSRDWISSIKKQLINANPTVLNGLSIRIIEQCKNEDDLLDVIDGTHKDIQFKATLNLRATAMSFISENILTSKLEETEKQNVTNFANRLSDLPRPSDLAQDAVTARANFALTGMF